MSTPVAILGATGYAGEGALRLLLRHPDFTLVHIGSDRLAGTAISEAVPALAGLCDLTLAPDTPEALLASGAEAIVLAKKSPEVTGIVPQLLASGLRIIDIGAEFRMRHLADYERWYQGPHDCPEVLSEAVYGLCEVHTAAIRAAHVVGNPGCYATSILLPLIPLFRANLISGPLVSVSHSGASGAGKRHLEGNNNLYYAVNENIHAYKTLAHQHSAEIDQELSCAHGEATHLHFVPHLAPLTRGIHSCISAQLRPGISADAIATTWQEAYGTCPFIRLRSDTKDVEVANVANTNFCDFAYATDGDCLIICSVVDNLIKGAAGQAVQNLNLMYGLDETRGLLHLAC